MALGEMEQACTLGQDTVERCRRVFGRDHRMTLSVVHIADVGRLPRVRQ